MLYVLDDALEHMRPLGDATRWWLHHSLTALAKSLDELGVPLVLRSGTAEEDVPAVAAECGADTVLWNRRYGAARAHDAAIKTALRDGGIDARSFAGDLLFEPWHVSTGEGTPYRVYSPFWRACNGRGAPAKPLPAPERMRASTRLPSDDLNSWQLLPTRPDSSTGLAERWSPGEAATDSALDAFLVDRLSRYGNRDIPSEDTGSELSPHLRFGEISPRTVWHRAARADGDVGLFLSELGWREFAKHTEYHFGPLHRRTFNERFDEFPWQREPDDEFEAWTMGHTGFGIVDAGMQELWQTGFMHNRVRMITASLLTKKLGFDWRLGEAWFWDTLVDADDASNPFNWQWVAGCGAAVAPSAPVPPSVHPQSPHAPK